MITYNNNSKIHPLSSILCKSYLFIGVLVCLFAGCSSKQTTKSAVNSTTVTVIERHSVNDSTSPEPPTKPVVTFKNIKHITQDWATYVADRKTEGYRLLSVQESTTWLSNNLSGSKIATGSNHKYNIRSVHTFTATYTFNTHNRVDKVLIVNDAAGKLRVFQQ